VEGDLIPQQLAASKRNMIAILPQGKVSGGSLKDKFGITDLPAYVREVLAPVPGHIRVREPGKLLFSLSPVRTVVSGHSGGGPSAVGGMSSLQPGAGASDDAWAAAPPLFLFDAINGLGELDTLTTLVRSWLSLDLEVLGRHTEAEGRDLLKRRGLKLRSTYTSGVYWACNTKAPPRTYQYAPHPAVTVPEERTLEYVLDKWFADHSSALGANEALLKSQYVVEHMTGSHDFTVGAGTLQQGSRSSVAGVTQAPGAPASSTQAPDAAQGNLAKALGLLSPAAGVPPPTGSGG
jgi:hypothetical protein